MTNYHVTSSDKVQTMSQTVHEQFSGGQRCLRRVMKTGSRRPISFPDTVSFDQDGGGWNKRCIESSGSKFRFSDTPDDIPTFSEGPRDVNGDEYVAMTGSDRRSSPDDIINSEGCYVQMNAPMSVTDPKGTSSGSLQKKMIHGKATLRLAVYINSGMLTVHLRRARHLSSISGSPCNPFIKVSLEPDDTEMTRCCTDVITDNNHPMFEEKFSFELLEDDYKKRVLISILNRTSEGSESEFLGGMSFGVWHIYTHKRTIDGWYYLLHRDIARRKHVQVTVRERDKESLNDVKYSNSDIYATIENGGSKYVEAKALTDTPLVKYKLPLGTSTPHKNMRRSRVCVSAISCLQLIERQHLINRRHCNDWEFVYDASARGALGSVESATCDEDEQHPRDGRDCLESACRLQRALHSRDVVERVTSSNLIGRAIRQCVKEALTSPLKCASSSSHNKFLPDISRISYFGQEPNVNSSVDKTLVLTATDAYETININRTQPSGDPKLTTSNASVVTYLGRDMNETSEEDSYIFAVSRACEAFMSHVDNGQPRRQDSSTPPTARSQSQKYVYDFSGTNSQGYGLTPTPEFPMASGTTTQLPDAHKKRIPTRHERSSMSEFKENRTYRHNYANDVIIDQHYGEKRKRDYVNITDLSSNGSSLKDISATVAPSKRRKTAGLSFSRDARSRTTNEIAEKVVNGKRLSWRSSFRRAFRSRGTGSSVPNGDCRLMAPGTRVDGNGGQKKLGLIDKMKELKLGIHNSFSLLTKRHK